MPAKKQAPKTEPKAEPTSEDMMTPTENSSEQSAMLQLGGLWVNESKSGTKYMTGYFGNLKLMIFRNNYKSEDKHPDYVMYLAEKPRDTRSDDAPSPDDIPF